MNVFIGRGQEPGCAVNQAGDFLKKALFRKAGQVRRAYSELSIHRSPIRANFQNYTGPAASNLLAEQPYYPEDSQ